VANSSRARQPLRPYLLLLCLLALVGFFYFARPILIPVATAVLLAFVLYPLVALVQRRGLGRVPAVVLVVVLVFVFLGALGYVLSRQITGLLGQLPRYQGRVIEKIEGLRGMGEGGTFSRLRDAFREITTLVVEQEKEPAPPEEDRPGSRPGDSPDNPIYTNTAPSNLSRVLELAGPAGEGLVAVALVVVLVVFMLIQRENLRNRIVRLVGKGHIILTTRAFDEGAHRISRFLLMLLTVNVGVGLAIAAGLVVLGLVTGQPVLYRYALLWGFLTASLRFVPYLGTWLAAALLFCFNVATLPGWGLPLGVFAYFVAVEMLAANAAEPLLFGKSTGSSPVALLLAAAFWAWLWGPMGLILSTPLTVLLVLLGKYVPQLEFFEVLMGEEPALEPGLNYYQRLVAHDQDEASALAEEYLEANGAERLCHDVLLPALVQARKDRDRGDLDPDDQRFIFEATRDLLDDVAPLIPPVEGADGGPVVVACPARDEADELVLRMVAGQLARHGHPVEVLSSEMLTAEVLERVAQPDAGVVCVGSLAPGGLAQARYLCRRLRARCPEAKIVVGRWGVYEDPERVSGRLKSAGADFVAATVAETRAQLLALLQVATAAAERPSREPALAERG
jgi:predicted PurR-regulated permease PerM